MHPAHVVLRRSGRVDEAFHQHYSLHVEQDRLAVGGDHLELVRTVELLERVLPEPPARVLDIGGGPGVYAALLARRGYSVHLIDVLPLHVEQAHDRALEQPQFPLLQRLETPAISDPLRMRVLMSCSYSGRSIT